VVVGPSGSGKSTLWRILRLGLHKIGKEVKKYTMNPKAMHRTQVIYTVNHTPVFSKQEN
jgi:dynein heavy chain 2